MVQEKTIHEFLHKIIDRTKSGKLVWERNWLPDSEYGMGYTYNAALKSDVNIEIFRYCSNGFVMGDVLPSFKLQVGKHNSQYTCKNNDSCHKVIINICILIDSIIQNDSDRVITDYIK